MSARLTLWQVAHGFLRGCRFTFLGPPTLCNLPPTLLGGRWGKSIDLKGDFTMVKVTPDPPSTMFMVAPEIDTESLLANACESLASAKVMLAEFAAVLNGPNRSIALGIAQIVMLGELAVNRALDNIDPQQ